MHASIHIPHRAPILPAIDMPSVARIVVAVIAFAPPVLFVVAVVGAAS